MLFQLPAKPASHIPSAPPLLIKENNTYICVLFINTNRIIAQVMSSAYRKNFVIFSASWDVPHTPATVGIFPHFFLPLSPLLFPNTLVVLSYFLLWTVLVIVILLKQICGNTNFIINFADDMRLSTDVPFSCCEIPSRLKIFLSIVI